jgi:hypothetical protein
MPGATIPTDGYGPVAWVNDEDNWREEDADFLQQRTILRWANSTARTAAGGDAYGPGSLSYVASSKTLAVNTSTATSGWSTVLHSPQLNITDTPASNFQIQLSGSSAGGLRFYTDGVFVDTRLAVAGTDAAPKVKIDANGILLETQTGNQGLIQTNNSGQVSISAGAGLTVNRLNVSSSATFSSAVTFSAAINITSTLTTTNLSVNNPTTPVGVGAGGLTSSTGVLTGLSLATVSGYQLGSTGLTRSSNAGAAITINSSAPAVSGANVDLQVPTGGAIRLTIAGNTAPIAGWMVSNTAPGGTVAPDGTIWFQVS